jgi:hypothetical protein
MKILSSSIIIATYAAIALASPSYSAEKDVAAETRFECKLFATDEDFDRSDLPAAFSFDVVGNPRSLESKWTMVRPDGATAVAETFEGTYSMHGSLGLKVTTPDDKSGNLYLIFGEDIPSGPVNFWLGFDRPNFFQPGGYGCDNENALSAGAAK